MGRGVGVVRLRRIAASAVVVLACVGVLASTVAVWTTRTLFDTDRFEALADDVLAQPEVTAALDAYLVDQVLTLVDVDRIAQASLPPELERLRPAIAAGLAAVVDRAVARLTDDGTVRRALVRALGAAHARLLRALEGEGIDGARMQVGDGVTINMLPVIDEALRALQRDGVLDGDRRLPTLASGDAPSAQLEQLAETFDRDLPDDFGQFTILDDGTVAAAGDLVDRARRSLEIAKRGTAVLVAATVALLALAFWSATDRWRAGAALALGISFAMVTGRLAVDRLVDAIPAQLARGSGGAGGGGDPAQSEAAARSVLGTAVSEFRTLVTLFAVLAAVVGTFAIVLHRRSGLTDARPPSVWWSELLAQWGDLVRVAAAGVGLLILVAGGLRWWSIGATALWAVSAAALIRTGSAGGDPAAGPSAVP